MTQAIEVAIIGGGAAGLTTALELTKPHHAGRYRVTVYQEGWRLGGKGASGRGKASRIEEHGLHLLLGFYDNTFAMLRAVYDELSRDPRRCHIASWRDALVPDPVVGLADQAPDGTWRPWIAHFPAGPGDPGDPWPGGRQRFSVRSYMVRGVALLRELFASAYRRQGITQPEPAPDHSAPRANPVDRLLRSGGLLGVAAVIEALELLKTILVGAGQPQLAIRLLDALTQAGRALLPSLTADDDGLRRIWEVIDLVLAILRGTVRFGLAVDPRGFDAIDDYDWREWLRLNGASESSVSSAFIRGIYNLTLAYRDGDVERPALSAGCALRGSVRMFFGYRGALFWRMTAGMGDIVFAPIYQVLRRRGVEFRFFHRLTEVGLDDPKARPAGARPHVATLRFDVQARPRGERYEPLVEVRGLPCWPSEPRWDRLEDGEALREAGRRFESHWDRHAVEHETLRVGEDFDTVVLATGIGAVAPTCQQLVEHDERWRAMVSNIKGVASQALQIWLRSDMRQLGWTAGPVNLAGFMPPFETWSDMRHVLSEEHWPQAPRALAYFCSVLPTPEHPPSDADYPARRREEVRRNVVSFLEHDIVSLWPNAVDEASGFRWAQLCDPEDPGEPCDPSGPERIESQYYTANIDPSALYTLSLPGTSRHRLSPLYDAFDNFTIAGDWTESGLNTGCLEGAVMSGMLAAHAISLSPRLDAIVGYDHP